VKGNFDSSLYGIEKTEYKNINLMFSRRSAILLRKIPQNPFVPSNDAQRNLRARQILTMQVQGLIKRMNHIGCNSVVLGLSGGLDSTLALIVCVEAFKKNQLSLENIRVFTLPCFGTSERTYNNAFLLAKELGVNIQEIRIEKAILQHFEDIGQDKDKHDVAFENSQARERTQILMDYANKCDGLVVGTGDLSELALGWATYNGDHMSNYGVNADVPKTLIRYIVKWYADMSEALCQKKNESSKLSQVLYDILDTPVSPELLPPKEGQISQKTEDLVGPYELHDFFLYYMLRWGFTPKKIRLLAEKAFDGTYSREVITNYLKIFIRRFFNNQFKRSCLPDGVAIGSVGLSPRSSWKMPSDACYSVWMKELE
jgi:NAD+ synthase (glutamine-hydrolysing)